MAVWHTPDLPWAIIAIATIGALIAGLVPHIGWRLVGLLGTCLVFFWQAPRLRSGDFDLTVLDVGQGLAVVLLTRNYAMVYDTGPKFPSGRDMGAAVLVPYLHSRGVRRVDLLVLSHTDIDHAGGAAALGAAFPITQRLVGTSTPACVAGQTFHWDGVAIEVLGPIDSHTQGNDGSCVLSVRSGAGSVLLPGDISRRAERQLAAAGHLPQSDVAIVPHHGSRGSSSPEFIAAVKPRWALVSAGHLNRFGFPKAEVVAHWEQNGAIVRSTAVDGALTFHARAAAEEEPIDAERSVHRHYFSVD
jgi:competence protein ComEC